MTNMNVRGYALWLILLLAPAMALAQGSEGAAGLLAKYKANTPLFEHNMFGRPLMLESTEAPDKLIGDIHAVIDQPFGKVSDSLKAPAVWCEILMLHLNTKHCAVQESAGATTVAVALGRKFDQPVSEAQRIEFAWRPATLASDYLSVELTAPSGPLATRNYRIELEATPLDAGKTIIHLAYSYSYGFAARLAMQGYLATIGSDKVGFTVTGKDSAGQPDYVGGVRGVVERNTMRYYLAIDAYVSAPGDQRLDERLAQWFDGTERFARQLHEVDRGDYIAMKHREFTRMKATR